MWKGSQLEISDNEYLSNSKNTQWKALDIYLWIIQLSPISQMDIDKLHQYMSFICKTVCGRTAIVKRLKKT